MLRHQIVFARSPQSSNANLLFFFNFTCFSNMKKLMATSHLKIDHNATDVKWAYCWFGILDYIPITQHTMKNAKFFSKYLASLVPASLVGMQWKVPGIQLVTCCKLVTFQTPQQPLWFSLSFLWKLCDPPLGSCSLQDSATLRIKARGFRQERTFPW